MNRIKFLLLIILPLVFVFQVNAQKQKADLLLYNAHIYTVDASFSGASAIAVKNGKILSVGNSSKLRENTDAAETIDAKGAFIYPGFIDAHAHFFDYSLDINKADLVGTTSWEEVLQRLQHFAQDHPEGWLQGRGWDQNDWQVKEFPTMEKLNELFPDRPVYLVRVDGHAAIANQKALDMAGIQAGMTLQGGTIEVKNGKLTGVLIDNAKEKVASSIPRPTLRELTAALLQGQKNCFAAGLTTVADCGLAWTKIMFLDSLQKKGLLKMKVFAMLSDAPENYAFAKRTGKIKTPYLNVRAFKVYADGALGSRGACLLEPYTDRAGWKGFLLSEQKHFDEAAQKIEALGFQMCTHAIGDSGNRTMLHIYGKYLKQHNDLRWRIEHAQIVNMADFELFGRYSIIPSVQPTHATSDMYWAKARLGAARMKGAYAFKELMKQNGWIPLGTDFPVEDIDPLKTFYAAVFRQDTQQFPKGGFQMENALSRKQALMGMTIWAAKASFEENEKGSLEPGKMADLILLDHDIMSIPQQEILKTKVLMTMVNGEKVYEAKR